MRRGRNLKTSFIVAIFLHIVGVVCAGRFLIERALPDCMVPAFKKGDLSFELTLARSDHQQEGERVPSAVPPPPPAVVVETPVPVEPTEAVPVRVAEQLLPDADKTSALDSREPSTPVAEDAQASYSGVENKGAEGPGRPDESPRPEAANDGVDGMARPLSDGKPVYPLGPRMRGEEGSVVLKVQVDALGRVDGVKVIGSSGYSGLDNAAVKAVKRTVFVPARSGGKPRAGEAQLTIKYCLVDQN